MTEKEKPALPVGTELGPFEYTITEKMADLYVKAIDNRDPLFDDADPKKRRMIPSCFSLQDYIYLLTQKSAWGIGGVHTAQESEYFNPYYVGDRVVTRGKIVDRYEKKGRNYFVMEYFVETDRGTLIARHRITGITFNS